MIVSLDTFNAYSGNYETSTTVDSIKETYLLAAEEVVEDYLGFHPTSAERTDILSGIGSDRIYPYAYNITEVDSLVVDDEEISSDDYEINDNYIRLIDDVFPTGNANVEITYKAGWTTSNMPSAITMTIMQIATLMLQEANGNIGITGKSFGENSRTFINYTNYDKWLAKIAKYKVFRME